MNTVTLIFIVIALYALFHGHHTRRRWRHHSHLPFGARVRVSVPGPFGTRISKYFD